MPSGDYRKSQSKDYQRIGLSVDDTEFVDRPADCYDGQLVTTVTKTLASWNQPRYYGCRFFECLKGLAMAKTYPICLAATRLMPHRLFGHFRYTVDHWSTWKSPYDHYVYHADDLDEPVSVLATVRQ